MRLRLGRLGCYEIGHNCFESRKKGFALDKPNGLIGLFDLSLFYGGRWSLPFMFLSSGEWAARCSSFRFS